MPYEFAGIKEKLKRANENIRNLEIEVNAFLKEGKHAIIPEHDTQLLLEAIEYHKNRVIPPRFSVLTGEIVHHLRSCLDHIVWELSDPYYREKYRWFIEFPILREEPIDKNDISRYERKIKGITNSKAVELIGLLQPYKAPDPKDTFLYIVHDLDRIDKHRELVGYIPTGAREFFPHAYEFVSRYQREHPELSAADLAFQLKPYGNLVPQISFKEFGWRGVQPVVPGLMELNNYIVRVISQFANL